MSRTRLFVATVCLVVLAAPSARAGSDAELTAQQERQKQIQAETEQVVRRVGTMLRVLEYYQVEKAVEKKMLEEVAVTLAGLSREQMSQVIARLDAASRAVDSAKSEKEVNEAYIRHREILDSLKGLLAKYDAVKSLDQVAERLDKAARIQLELHLVTTQLIQNAMERQKPILTPVQRNVLIKQFPNILLEKKRQGDSEGDLRREVEIVLKQAGELRAKLPADQQERLKAMEELAVKQRLMENFYRAIIKLGVPYNQFDPWKGGNKLQWEIAGQLRDLAAILRKPHDNVAALREVRDRLEQTLRIQENLKEQTKEQGADKATQTGMKAKGPTDPKKLTFPGTNPLPEVARNPKTGAKLTPQEQAAKEEQTAQKSADLSAQQARLQFETQQTQDLAKPIGKEVADKVEAAEKAMDNAKNALEKKSPDKAVAPQEKAVEALRDAKKDVEKLLAAAEKQKNDPLAALQKAADQVDKLLKDQTATRNQTSAAAKDQHNLKLPAIAAKQEDLAKRADELNETPLPNKEKAQAALDKATAEMKKAAESLLDKKADAAVPKQDKAIAALAEVKKAIAEQMADIEKRRDDIAKLENAAEKLDQLAKKEGKVAEKAKDLAEQPASPMTKELGAKQAQLTPETKEVGKQLEKTAPQAAAKVADAAKNMEAAKKDIDKNELKPAAKEADDAAQRLADAKKAVAKQLDELKGKEIADQAAMQPNKFDPNAAAQQIAKALEQTQQAAKESKQAEAKAKLDQPGPKKDLTKLQEQVAKKAAELNLPEAGKPAQTAADALKKSDLEKAVAAQEKALGKLKEAAANDPNAEAEPKASTTAVKPAEAKEGNPMAAKAVPAPHEAGEPKTADAKKGLIEPAQAKPGEAKEGQKAAEAKPNQLEPAQAKAGTPPSAASKAGEPKSAKKAGQAKAATAKAGQPKANPKTGKPNPVQAKANPPKSAAALAKTGQPMQGELKTAQVNAGQAKTGQPMNGEAKPALAKNNKPEAQPKAPQPQAKSQPQAQAKGMEKSPEAAEAKAGQDEMKEGEANAQAKGQGKGEMEPADAKNPAQLAEAQKGLMEATKALAKSQEATDAAMAALGQAKAQAPEGLQKQLKEAGEKLAEAGKQIKEAKPGQAGEAQEQAAAKLESALKTLNQALAAMGQPDIKPGQTPTAQASAAPKPGQEPGQPKEGQGKEGAGKKLAQAQGKGKQKGRAMEKNTAKGKGERQADGKLANAKSELKQVQGDGSFLHLPPRQREMIRQALAGQLPPEYAAMIQQYYVNIARGRPATMPGPVAPPGAPKR